MYDNVIIAEWIETVLATNSKPPRNDDTARPYPSESLASDIDDLDRLRSAYEQLVAHQY